MPLYDCGAPDCDECRRAFGPDRSAAIAAHSAREVAYGKITGRIVGAEPSNEAEHFIVCAACGQAIDCRDLGEVFHHEEPGHDPIERARA